MKVTLSIIIISFMVFVIQVVVQPVSEIIALIPTLALSGMYWQFFTYMFAHASIHHLGFNMLGLFIFGVTVERFLGIKRYLSLYILSGIGSGLFHIVVTGVSDIPMVGASGAVFAILTAYAIKFPESRILIFPIMYPIKAIYAVGGFILISIVAGLTGFMPGIAHFGHLGGILFGGLMMYLWMRRDRKTGGLDDFDYAWESW